MVVPVTQSRASPPAPSPRPCPSARRSWRSPCVFDGEDERAGGRRPTSRPTWARWDPGVPLAVLHTEYASVVEPDRGLHRRPAAGSTDDQIVVLIPTVIPSRLRYRILHNQIDLVLSAALRSPPRRGGGPGGHVHRRTPPPTSRARTRPTTGAAWRPAASGRPGVRRHQPGPDARVRSEPRWRIRQPCGWSSISRSANSTPCALSRRRPCSMHRTRPGPSSSRCSSPSHQTTGPPPGGGRRLSDGRHLDGPGAGVAALDPAAPPARRLGRLRAPGRAAPPRRPVCPRAPPVGGWWSGHEALVEALKDVESFRADLSFGVPRSPTSCSS